MNANERLRQLIEAEKAAAIAPSRAAQVWSRLASTAASSTPAMSVPLSVVSIGTRSLLEGAAIAVVVGAVGATAIVATAPMTNRAVVVPSLAAAAPVHSRSVASPSSESRPALPVAAASVVIRSEAVSVPSRAVPSVLTPAGSTTGSAPSILDEELQMIGRAKHYIDRGQPHLAQIWLDEHRSKFPAGVLAAERDGLDTLMACGRSDAATASVRAQTYSEKYPDSPLLDRIRRACRVNSAGEIPK